MISLSICERTQILDFPFVSTKVGTSGGYPFGHTVLPEFWKPQIEVQYGKYALWQENEPHGHACFWYSGRCTCICTPISSSKLEYP